VQFEIKNMPMYNAWLCACEFCQIG